jgi:hypothetical protein
MQEVMQTERDKVRNGDVLLEGVEVTEMGDSELDEFEVSQTGDLSISTADRMLYVRRELSEIRDLLSLVR